MSESKPLHVLVAEALGWTEIDRRGYVHHFSSSDADDRREWTGFSPWQHASTKTSVGHQPIPRYDTDWRATGPLIEKHGINLSFAISERHEHRFEWIAGENVSDCRCVGRHVWDKSPLVAVCRVLIDALPNGLHQCSREALKEAGKL